MVANPNFFILVPSSLIVLGRFCNSIGRSRRLNTQFRELIPMAVIGRQLAGIDYPTGPTTWFCRWSNTTSVRMPATSHHALHRMTHLGDVGAGVASGDHP